MRIAQIADPARLAARKPPSIWLVLVTFAVTAAVGLVIVSAMTRPGPAPTAQSGPVPTAEPGELPVNLAQPLFNVNGQKTTVAGAQATVGFPVPMPNDTAASSASLTSLTASRTSSEKTTGPRHQTRS